MKLDKPAAVGTSVDKPTLAPPMDDKTINLWRQIEGARRIGKRRVTGATKPDAPPLRPPANDLG